MDGRKDQWMAKKINGYMKEWMLLNIWVGE